jgi:hypothetical protein
MLLVVGGVQVFASVFFRTAGGTIVSVSMLVVVVAFCS